MSYTLDGYLIGRNPQSPMPPELNLLSRDSDLSPIRQKRRQVKNACTRCQKACKKCDDARPCLRCVRYGCTDGCISSVRKERKKGFKRGPYKKRDAEAQLLLSRVSSLRPTRNNADTQHAANTSMSAFTHSPLTDTRPSWVPDHYHPAHPHPSYQPALEASAGYAPTHYLAAADNHQVSQYPDQLYLQAPSQAAPHPVQYVISPGLPQGTHAYVAMGHKQGVPAVMSYHQEYHS